jgi:O-antigen/teichoic acid export membrane protein
MTAGLLGAGPSLVAFLYDSRYQEAGWMLQVLAVAMWFQTLETLESSVLWTLGHTRAPALSNAAKLLALVAFVPLGQWMGGFRGLLLGFVAADAVRYVATLRALHRSGVALLRTDAYLSVLVVICAVSTVATGMAVGSGAGNRMGWLWRLAAEASVVAAFWLIVATLWRLGQRVDDAPGTVVAIEGQAC